MNKVSPSLTTQIINVRAGSASRISDLIIKEKVLRIVVNETRTYDMVYSTGNPVKLATGWLFTQGMIEKKTDIIDCEMDAAGIYRVVLKDSTLLNGDHPLIRGSSGGHLVPGIPNRGDRQGRADESGRPWLGCGQVEALMDLHFEHSKLFKKTGAVHSAGLTDGSSMLAFFEDIGRHNALDKLIGHMLLEDIDSCEKAITLSCRMSLEIVGKVIRAGIPLVMSNAAPTLTAVELARENGLTMVGFARGDRFNIYSHPQRISISTAPVL